MLLKQAKLLNHIIHSLYMGYEIRAFRQVTVIKKNYNKLRATTIIRQEQQQKYLRRLILWVYLVSQNQKKAQNQSCNVCQGMLGPINACF